MPDTSITESLLALFAGNDRAAAILGDLTEMAQTRGRFWFWLAYLRIMFELTWRTPVALILAVVSIKYVRSHLLGRWISFFIGNSIPFSSLVDRSYFHAVCWTISFQTASPLWIVMPYVAIRFGLRNRLTYLATALFLVSVPAYAMLPRAVDTAGVLTALITVTALALPLWRRPMTFLAINYIVQNLVYTFCHKDPLGIFHHGVYYKSLLGMRIDGPMQIAVMVMVCPFLHRWLLEDRPSADRLPPNQLAYSVNV